MTIQTTTLETTRAHRSFEALKGDVEEKCDTNLSNLFEEGEVRKTLLSTAQVRVVVVIPFGTNIQSDRAFEVTFMSNGKPRTVKTEFASEVEPILEEVFKSLANEAVTRLSN